MKRFFSLLLALHSAMPVIPMVAATRPHYGGVLHLAMRAAPASLDPAEINRVDWLAGANLSRILFDTLVGFDDRGDLQPALAVSWYADPGDQRWHFSLRRRVTFSDGTPLGAELAAGSLRTANPHWKILPAGDEVLIETDSPNPNLAAELALPQNSIVNRRGAQISGTGAFVISRWETGKKLTVGARNDYWGGRPFVDSIEIEFGQSFKQQAISLDLHKVQVIEAAPVGRPSAMDNYTLRISAAVELMALVFNAPASSPEEARLRHALALSIDRDSLNSVVLQGGGEPSGGLLPNWMTGYEFIFPHAMSLERAQQELGTTRQKRAWTLAYDGADPISRVIAERIILNARDAGLALQLAGGDADLRLIRVALVSPDPYIALTHLAEMLKLGQPKFADHGIADLYAAENNLLQSQQILPLLHLRIASEALPAVHNWLPAQDGSWRMQYAWIAPDAQPMGRAKP
jgi:ABC-type transport system substrate-binding protein